jgi:TonB-linked SusC/RagA family outer membrane protein
MPYYKDISMILKTNNFKKNSMQKRFTGLFALFLLCCTASMVVAQNVSVSGTVIDTNNDLLIGVNVQVKGTTTGTVTDIDGKFSLSVPDNKSVLVFSYIGYLPQEITVGTQRTMNITLWEDLQSLDEVVVVGYGTQRKRDLTGSVGSLDNTTITKQNAVNSTTALRGQIAGLSVQQTSGRAGSEATVILRGQSAIGKTVQPLVIIDGIPSSWSILNDISPEDIDRIDVLKDASSTAIYGSRASGGVVIVSTRAGRETNNTINYSGSVGIKKLTNNPKVMNTQQYYQMYLDGLAFRGEPTDNKIMADDQKYIDDGINTDWLDFILRDGFQTTHNISLSGGNKNETHYFSLGYFSENGIQKSEEYERFSLNARITGKVIDKLTAGASMYASYAVNGRGDQNMLNSAYRLRPWGNPYNDDGSYRFYPTQNESQLVNPIFDLDNTKWEDKRMRIRGNVFLEYIPLEGLSIKTNFMPMFGMSRQGDYVGEWTRQNVGKEGTSRVQAQNDWNIGYLWENTFAYTKRMNDHSIGFTGLFSMENNVEERYTGNVTGLTYPNEYWYNLGASTSVAGLSSRYRAVSMIS